MLRRPYSTDVADMSTTPSPQFTQRVVKAMRSLYPEELADRAWDNVGLLQDNLDLPGRSPSRVLLTNDLTLRVADEAVRKKVSVVVTYHPFLISGLKSFGLQEPRQRLVVYLASNNVAVYCPHTAVDAAPGGLNDFLAEVLSRVGNIASISVTQPLKGPTPEGFESAGYGRTIELAAPVALGAVAKAYAAALGLSHVSVARARPAAGQEDSATMVQKVAVCAGSGYDVLKDSGADLIVTGEMAHHNALRLTMLGTSVITTFHSNSERAFLAAVLQPKLLEILKKEDESAEVLVSEEDRDPFETWDVEKLPSYA